jgi:hypothetical protein
MGSAMAAGSSGVLNGEAALAWLLYFSFYFCID